MLAIGGMLTEAWLAFMETNRKEECFSYFIGFVDEKIEEVSLIETNKKDECFSLA